MKIRFIALMLGTAALIHQNPTLSHGRGGAVAGGLLGGFALGSIITAANRPRHTETVVYQQAPTTSSYEQQARAELARERQQLEQERQKIAREKEIIARQQQQQREEELKERIAMLEAQVQASQK